MMKTTLTPEERIQAYQHALYISKKYSYVDQPYVFLSEWLLEHSITYDRMSKVYETHFPEIPDRVLSISEIPIVLKSAIGSCREEISRRIEQRNSRILKLCILLLIILFTCALLFSCRSSKSHYCPTYKSYTYKHRLK